MVLGRAVRAELGLISGPMAARHKANANGKIVLVMDVVWSRNVALDLDLARAGVKTGPYVGKRQRGLSLGFFFRGV